MSDTTITHSEMVARLAKPGAIITDQMSPAKAHLLHMVVGISGESGELIDAVKKYAIYGKSLDRENLIEELGDIEFYLEGFRQGLGVSRAQTIEANILKLGKRYPDYKYTDKNAIARADKEGPMNEAALGETEEGHSTRS